MNKCPICKKQPSKVKIIGNSLMIKGIGCCGSFFHKEADWDKFTVETVVKTESKKTPAAAEEKTITIQTNPRLSDQANAVIRHWNSKSLRKHKNLNATVVLDAAKSIDALIRGEFPAIGVESPIPLKQILASIDVFEVMANDHSVKPYRSDQKAILKKLSLNDFIYSERFDISQFKQIFDKGSKLETQYAVFSEEVFAKIVKKAFLLHGKKLSPSELSRMAKFTGSVKNFWDDNKGKITGSVVGLAKRVLVHVCRGKSYVPFNLLVSDEIETIIKRVCVEEGFILQASSVTEDVQYSNKKKNTTTDF